MHGAYETTTRQSDLDARFDAACNSLVWSRIIANGYPMPLVLGGKTKATTEKGWQTKTGPGQYVPGNNIGLRCGESVGDAILVAIDVDVTDEAVAATLRKLPIFDGLPVRYGNRPKFLALCRMPAAPFKNPEWTKAKHRPFRVQIIAAGGYFATFGWNPDANEKRGGFYEWEGGGPTTIPAESLRLLDSASVLAALDKGFAEHGYLRKSVAKGFKSQILPFVGPSEVEPLRRWARDCAMRAIAKIEFMPPKSGRGTEAFKLGSAIALAGDAALNEEVATRLLALDDGYKHAREFGRGLEAELDFDLNASWRYLTARRSLGDLAAQARASAAISGEAFPASEPSQGTALGTEAQKAREASIGAGVEREETPAAATAQETAHSGRLLHELTGLASDAAAKATAGGGGEPNTGPATRLVRRLAALVDIGALRLAEIQHMLWSLANAANLTADDVKPWNIDLEDARAAWLEFKAKSGERSYADCLRSAELVRRVGSADRMGNGVMKFDSFNGSETAVVSEVVRDLIGKDGDPEDLMTVASNIYLYGSGQGTWAIVPEHKVEAAIELCHGLPYETSDGTKQYVVTQAKKTHILKRIERAFARDDAFEQTPPGIMLADGFLSVERSGAAKIEPKRRELHCRAALPTSWNAIQAAKESKHFLAALDRTFAGDASRGVKIRALQETAAVAIFGLHHRLRRRAIVWLIGAAGAGKSVFIQLLRRVIPEEYARRVDPERFADKFYSVRLIGVRLAFNTYMVVDRPIPQDVLKAAVDLEPIDYEIKYGKGGEFTPQAQWVVASNKPL